MCEPIVDDCYENVPSAFATCHFESGGGSDSKEIRNEQLKMCLSLLQGSYKEDCILMGDFNFSSEVKDTYDIIGEQGFKEVGGDEIGETMARNKGYDKG